MNLAKYSLDNTKIIFFFLAVLLIGGVLSFGNLGKKEDAPFVIKTAVIITRYPGAAPAEVERLITEPISREIQSMSGVNKIKSESMYGISKITFELLPSLSASSIPQKWDELRRKVLNIQPMLPSGASLPTVSDDFGDVFGIYYGLTADEGFSYEEMRNWAERIKTGVVTAEGVMKVALFGVQTEVINIFVSVNKLAGMGIDPKQLAGLLQSQNQIINTGEIKAGEQQLRVVANGMYTTVNDIRNQVLTTKAGQVKLGDIAIIEKGYMDPPSTIMHVNGKRAIGIGVSTDPDKDVVKTGKMVDAKLSEILPLMPVGLQLEDLYLENEIAREANNGFIINLIESILIVIVIIMLVMGLRAGLLIGSSLIFSIGGTLLIMSFFGVGLNRTSLAGFIIAMGMLVDNAIVVTDNAQIAIARGVDRRKALIDGATGPQWGLLGATFIAICSFLPLYLAPSAVAEIVKPLFIVLAISLGLSWLLALTQTTTFGNLILKAKAVEGAKDPYDKPFYHKFASILAVLINKKLWTIGSMIALFIVSLVIMGNMSQNFFPSLDKPYFRADVFYPDGYSINDVTQQMEKVEAHLLQQPNVKRVSVTFGNTPLRYYLASTSVGPKPNFANILIELTDSKYTKKSEEQFDNYMKANYPNAITRTSLFKLSPAVDAAIEIGFIGNNVDTLVMLTNKALDIMHRNSNLINVRNSWGNKIPVWDPIFSQERAQPLGVSRQGMAQSIQIGTNGMP
ncbi:efflux RND transporter permease subunit, partial [Bacteroides sp.]